MTTAAPDGPLNRSRFPDTWAWADPRTHVIADLFDVTSAAHMGKKHKPHPRAKKTKDIKRMGTARDWDEIQAFLEKR